MKVPFFSHREISHTVPDISIHGNLSSVHCSLDLYKYKLIRGLLENNLGEPIEEFMRPYDLQDPRIHVSETLYPSVALLASADGASWAYTPQIHPGEELGGQMRCPGIFNPTCTLALSPVNWSAFPFSRLFWVEKCTRACASLWIWSTWVWNWKTQREKKVLVPWPGVALIILFSHNRDITATVTQIAHLACISVEQGFQGVGSQPIVVCTVLSKSLNASRYPSS